MNNRNVNIGITSLFVLSLFVVFSTPVAATDFYVYEGDLIQLVINVAEDGDVIYVHEGTYSENLLIDGVDVSLIAVGNVTIDGTTNSFSNKTIAIYNSVCTIDGFTVKNNGGAIYARGMTSEGDSEVDVVIKNNTVKDYIKNVLTL